MLSQARFSALPRLAMKGHGHAVWHGCIVLQGDFQEQLSGSLHDCPAGVARLSRPGVVHDIAFGSNGGECLIFEFNGPFWSRVARRLMGGDEPSRYRAGPDHPRGLAGHSLSMTQITPLFTVEDGKQAPAWLEEVSAEIAHGAAGDLSRIARLADLHRGSLWRHFRSHFGLTPAEYRVVLRTERAAACLSESDAPLAEIALDCGYAHQSHMTNDFQRVLGRTPGDLRRESRDVSARSEALVVA